MPDLFLGAIGTILTFTIFGDIRTYPIKLIMFLCACIAAGYEISPHPLASSHPRPHNSYAIFFFAYRTFVVESWLCWPVSMLILYFFLANFSWMFCVAFNFYQMIVRRNRESEALEKWYHVGCWGAPLIVVICVAATKNFGRVGDPANLYAFTSPPSLMIAHVPV